jgi:O-6-methylguanine DNA methyltransferase
MEELQTRVLELVSMIPKGKVTTYKELAQAVGKPRAWRVIANVLTRNPRPVKIPCYRVVRSDGRVGGYQLGTKQKEKLLMKEGVELINGKVDLVKYMFRFRKSRFIPSSPRTDKLGWVFPAPQGRSPPV